MREDAALLCSLLLGRGAAAEARWMRLEKRMRSGATASSSMSGRKVSAWEEEAGGEAEVASTAGGVEEVVRDED